MRPLAVAAASLLLLFSMEACRCCTLIGCYDMLTLEVRAPDGGLVEHFRGVVTLEGEDQTFECPAPAELEQQYRCPDAGNIEVNLSHIGRTGTSRLIGQPPDALPVSLTAEDGGLGWSRTLSPSTWFANGPSCGPECISHHEAATLEQR